MATRNPARYRWLAALAAWACLVSAAAAQDRGASRQGRNPSGDAYGRAAQSHRQPAAGVRPPYRVAERAGGVVQPQARAQPREHPLAPAIRWAREGLHNMRQIQDYSAVLVKRERVEGELLDEQYIYLKVRHKPFSVYLYFLKPDSLQGQEVMWVENKNDGKMWAHGTGMKAIFGTVSLNPTSALAMDGNRYPITDIGILHLVQRLLEVAQEDSKYGECEVKFIPGVKLNGRACTCLQVTHPVPRRNFLFHLARIFIDDELNVPIRYEAYDWPAKPGEKPPLVEQYTYLDLKVNNGFTDADFDVRNPNYGF
jgi:hypothetical protein